MKTHTILKKVAAAALLSASLAAPAAVFTASAADARPIEAQLQGHLGFGRKQRHGGQGGPAAGRPEDVQGVHGSGSPRQRETTTGIAFSGPVHQRGFRPPGAAIA
ncbi:hypothetical protein [Mycolicibacterium sp. XJ1904]